MPHTVLIVFKNIEISRSLSRHYVVNIISHTTHSTWLVLCFVQIFHYKFITFTATWWVVCELGVLTKSRVWNCSHVICLDKIPHPAMCTVLIVFKNIEITLPLSRHYAVNIISHTTHYMACLVLVTIYSAIHVLSRHHDISELCNHSFVVCRQSILVPLNLNLSMTVLECNQRPTLCNILTSDCVKCTWPVATGTGPDASRGSNKGCRPFRCCPTVLYMNWNEV